MIKGHGNNLYHFEQGAIVADFSSNIAFNHQSQLIIEHLSKQLHLIKHYPDPEARVLRELIAEQHGLAMDNILVTNGSAEAFYLLAHWLARRSKGAKSLIFTPSFAEYEDSCRLFEHKLFDLPIRNFLHTDLMEYDSVWLGCPNNPNGYRVSNEDISTQCHQYPQCFFILDCAYHELSDKSFSSTQPTSNQIITHSLTKSFGIPGIRLGYIIAPSNIIAELEQMRPPWAVNALAIEAGVYILNHYEQLLPDTEELLAESRFLQHGLLGVDGISLTASGCNFFLCQLTDGRSATQLQEYLIQEHGILIRHAGNFKGLSDCHFRLAAQSREQNLHLIQALQLWSSLPHSSQSL